jgi:UDP-glucuronate 4-epimerase
MAILITGAAGFIGFFLAQRLLLEGYDVCGVDNLNSYYAVSLKKDRLAQLQHYSNFSFERIDISHEQDVQTLFDSTAFDAVVHLAAQAGVRYSIDNPSAYGASNLTGFLNILEGCRHQKVGHLIFASSSSVYGANKKVPFSTTDNVDHPVSLYAATKKANELMAHAYSHLYQIPITGLRFFTVYGPWGRPDMAYFKFVDAIANDKPIHIYNHGKMKRDFTYVDDVVEGIVRLLKKIPQPEASSQGGPPYKIYNIGNNSPVELLHFIEVIEAAMGKSAQKVMMPMQPGDVPATYADVDDLIADIDFRPNTSLENGINRFVGWYREYFSVS